MNEPTNWTPCDTTVVTGFRRGNYREMPILSTTKKGRFGEKDEVEFWNTLSEMLLENSSGDVQQSNGRYSAAMNKNSAPQRWL